MGLLNTQSLGESWDSAADMLNIQIPRTDFAGRSTEMVTAESVIRTLNS